MSSYSDYILKCLKRLEKTRKVIYAPGNSIARIICPNPKHKQGKESDPSLRVNIKTSKGFRAGSAKCFSCAIFYSNWKMVANALNRPDLIDNSIQEESLEGNLDSFFDGTDDAIMGNGKEVSPDSFPFLKNAITWNENENWRGIKGQLIKDIGAKMIFDSNINITMLYLPVFVNSRHVGGVKANIKKHGKRNYFNTDGSWVNEFGLFPYDYVYQMVEKNGFRAVGLVEGPRDSLNLIQNNIPALAILGSHSWSDLKSDLVASLPVDTAITAFDPDDAGDMAKRRVFKSLRQEMEVKNFNLLKWQEKLQLKRKLDPGNAPAKVLESLRRYI